MRSNPAGTTLQNRAHPAADRGGGCLQLSTSLRKALKRTASFRHFAELFRPEQPRPKLTKTMLVQVAYALLIGD
ncbi:MAG: hypothetical protein ACLSF2_07375 [Butyricicoccus sp.]